jgi:hypothetical protein
MCCSFCEFYKGCWNKGLTRKECCTACLYLEKGGPGDIYAAYCRKFNQFKGNYYEKINVPFLHGLLEDLGY